MRTRLIFIIVLGLCLLVPVAAQQPPATGKQEVSPRQKQEKDDVVRISVTLVQVDAVVTDGKGRFVTDLKPEDFELLVDGRPQLRTNFSFVSRQPVPAPDEGKARVNNSAQPLPPVKLRPDEVRRTIALVVDD